MLGFCLGTNLALNFNCLKLFFDIKVFSIKFFSKNLDFKTAKRNSNPKPYDGMLSRNKIISKSALEFYLNSFWFSRYDFI